MTDTVASPAPVAASPSAKKLPAKKKVAASGASTHPTTAVMVTSAIKGLNEKKGSSLPAIKKYLAANYKIDPAKFAPFIRKFLKAAVINGTIVQTKGTGASGHFKLPVAAEVKPKKVAAKKKAPAAKKAKAAGTPKKKKPAAPKKVKPASGEPAAKKLKKTVAPAKPKAAAAKPKKSPAKPKKPAVAKPKAVKPKKSPIKKAAAPKKK